VVLQIVFGYSCLCWSCILKGCSFFSYEKKNALSEGSVIDEPIKERSDIELKLTDIITRNFLPGHKSHFEKSMTTLEVTNYLQRICPGEYTGFDVYQLLNDLGFVYVDIGGESEWLFLQK
jgi:hypothetical protein